MKKIYILFLIIFSTQLFSNELDWVNEQIEAIKPARKGINNSNISVLKDPFVFIKEKLKDDDKKDLESKKQDSKIVKTESNKLKVSPKLKKKTYILKAVINKSALINNTWYKVNSKIDKYKLSKIEPTSVLLIKGKTKLVLTTKSKNSNIKFKNN